MLTWPSCQTKSGVVSDFICLNTLMMRQNGRNFPDISRCVFLYENVWILIKISPRFAPKGPINNIAALVQVRAWHWPGDKPLSEQMIVRLLTDICNTRLQWVYAHGTPIKWLLKEWQGLICAGANAWQICSSLEHLYFHFPKMQSLLYLVPNYIFITWWWQR